MRNIIFSKIFMIAITAFAVAAPSFAGAAERPLYQWRDQQGIDNWADKNPLTDPSRQPKRDPQLIGKRTMPKLNVDAVNKYLQQSAEQRVPPMCQQRNADNPAQRSICEQFQYRALSKVMQFVQDPANVSSSFIYERCRSKWLNKKRTDFVSLAQCMGLKV